MKIGIANQTFDADGVARRQELLYSINMDGKMAICPAFSLLLVSKSLGKMYKQGSQGEVLLGGRAIPCIDGGVLINFAGPNGTFPAIPLRQNRPHRPF